MFGQLGCLCNGQGSQKGFFFSFLLMVSGVSRWLPAHCVAEGELGPWSSCLYLMLAGIRDSSPMLALCAAADGTQSLVHAT